MDQEQFAERPTESEDMTPKRILRIEAQRTPPMAIKNAFGQYSNPMAIFCARDYTEYRRCTGETAIEHHKARRRPKREY
jgi:hypothetical protein